MKINVVSLFPQMIQEFVQHGLLSQAIEKKIIELETLQPRDQTQDVHKTVDDRPFGGGDGMVMMGEPLRKTIEPLRGLSKIIYLTPQGTTLTDEKVRELSKLSAVTLICGRYGGIDQRFINEFVDEEVSIGDYVLSGGEVAACVIIEAISRMLPGVLGNKESYEQDSFAQGILEVPSYTRPQSWNGLEVPSVLLSGNHQLIAQWRTHVSIMVTLKKRPDLLLQAELSAEAIQKSYQTWKSMPDSEKKVVGVDLLQEEDWQMLEVSYD